MNKTFYIMCGVPGSGKSYWAQNLSTASVNSEIISSDNIRKEINGSESSQDNGKLVWDTLYERVKNTKQELIVIDATFVYRRDREKLVNFIRLYHIGALVNCFFLDTPLDVSLKQNILRERNVPEDVVKSFYNRLQKPDRDAENFDDVFVVGDYKHV